jgi:hypothetical protein
MGTIARLSSLLAFALGFCAMASITAQAADAMGDATFINPADINWSEAPPGLPKGSRVAVLYGDPGKAGPFVLRAMLPAGYKIPPHWHTQGESLTVISGTFYLGLGDTMDAAHAHALKAGGFHNLPPKGHHFAFTKGPTMLQIHGDGPFDINYINPADDPRNAKK